MIDIDNDGLSRDVKNVPIIEVLLPVPLDKTFDYRLDTTADTVGTSVSVGQRVVVEFGTSRRLAGVVVGLRDRTEADDKRKLKPVLAVPDAFPVVNAQWWQLMHFAARYYAEPLGKALKNAFPKRLRDVAPLALPGSKFFSLTEAGRQKMTGDRLPVSATRQRRLLTILAQQGRASATKLKSLGCTSADCDRALKNAWVQVETDSPYAETAPITAADYPLNTEQQQVIDNIQRQSDGFAGHLLDGVTGSGKTEVYMQLIEQVVINGGQVLLLVPEIGLTPQMLARFKQRFGNRVASYHSGMSDTHRRDVFLSAMAGDLPILIGTRSAIFVPMARLALLLIDEEHDLSYKQQSGFLYHARDLALFRGKISGINVVMGSATPGLESLHNVAQGKLQIHYLRQRATAVALPTISMVDRRGHSREQVLADRVIQKMRHTLQRGEQVLLFLNRRGFSPVMCCHACDWRSHCPACSVFLTAHVSTRQLCCHHCGYIEGLPLQCPQCGDSQVYFVGVGTEKLESQLNRQFPNHQILRLDRDNQTTAKQLDNALAQIHAGEIDIILGTQLVVKGHHFAKVTMVCIVDADSALFSSDFRAEERLYQQLIQVAGRAGREHVGQVYVQSSVPEHAVFHALIRHDYQAYAKTLLAERKQFSLPPYTAIALLKADAKTQPLVLEYLRAVKNALSEHTETIDILGPVPLAVEKVNHRYQAQLWLSATDKTTLQHNIPLLRQIITHFDRSHRFNTIIDVDAI